MSEHPQVPALLATDITRLFGIRHPIVLAGMNVAGAELAAAVSNHGGLGVIGGVGYTPKMLRRQIQELKSLLKDPKLPFGVDLLIPQVGGNARKTNTDYTGGKLPELIDIIIEEGAKLFVCAVGVPPKWAVDKLHANGILVQNMCGAPKHALKALESGADILCVQGGEGGGHTGEIATIVLIPQVVDLVRGRKSPLTGQQVPIIAAGGIYDGRGVAAALALGAQAVWVGTRFVASFESKAPPRHVEAVIQNESDQTIRTAIYTGRPMRVSKNELNTRWEEQRKAEQLQLLKDGIIPIMTEVDGENPAKAMATNMPLLMGQAVGGIKEQLPAAVILNQMIIQAAQILKQNNSYLLNSPVSTQISAPVSTSAPAARL